LFKSFANHSRLRMAIFVLFGFCVLGGSLTYFSFSITNPYIGVTLSLNNQVWVVQSVDSNGVAVEAGIRAGDIPLEINGQQANVFLKDYKDAGVVLQPLIKELTVIDEHNQLKSISVKNTSLSWDLVIESITLLIVCLTFWTIGFYVFLKRPKNAAASLLFLCGLITGLAINASMANQRGVLTASQIEILSMVVAPWLLLHFFLVLPEERVRLQKYPLVYLIYLPAAMTLVLFPFGYDNGQSLPWFRSFRFYELGIGFLAMAGAATMNYFRATSLKTRQQMKIVLVGCIAAIVPFSVLNVLPEAIWDRTVIPPGFGILFSIFIPLSMGYAVVKQKLMDIDVVIRRSVIYGSITLVMAAVLSVAIIVAISVPSLLNVPEEMGLALALGAIATFLFGPVKSWIELLVDKLIYKDRYDYRQIIQSLTVSLNLVKDVIEMSRLIIGTIVRSLNLAGACLYIKTQSGTFQLAAAQGIFLNEDTRNGFVKMISKSKRNNAIEFPNSASNVFSDLSFLIRLTLLDREVGLLCLSHKVSRQDFSINDIYLMQGVASVSAVELDRATLLRDVNVRNTFISVASHELRTPLTSIVGYSDLLLLRDPPAETRKEWLKNILENGQKMTTMVNDLLNISRIQSGKTSLKLKKEKVDEIFKEALSLIEQNSDNHEFVINLSPILPRVIVDRDKFTHVIRNLISNAVKYSPEGGQVTLVARNDPESHRVVLSVSDEGIGIGPEDRDLLFTTFHRIHRPETQSIGGSGLGLYIAKEWTEEMGGKIWFESELNKGSTFFIEIPTE
jgi:signal transduction histidine kinase